MTAQQSAKSLAALVVYAAGRGEADNPLIEKAIADAITAAVAAERERCARLAETHFVPGHAVAGPGFAAKLADCIRSGS